MSEFVEEVKREFKETFSSQNFRYVGSEFTGSASGYAGAFMAADMLTGSSISDTSKALINVLAKGVSYVAGNNLGYAACNCNLDSQTLKENLKSLNSSILASVPLTYLLKFAAFWATLKFDSIPENFAPAIAYPLAGAIGFCIKQKKNKKASLVHFPDLGNLERLAGTELYFISLKILNKLIPERNLETRLNEN